MAIGDDGLDLVSLSDPELTQGLAVAALVDHPLRGRAEHPAAGGAPDRGAGAVAGDDRRVRHHRAWSRWSPGRCSTSTAPPRCSSARSSRPPTPPRCSPRSVGSPMPRRLGNLLEVESGANDPMAVHAHRRPPGRVGGPSRRRRLGRVRRAQPRGRRADRCRRSAGSARSCSAGCGWRRRRSTRSSRWAWPGSPTASGAATRSSGFLAVYVAGMVVADRAPSQRRAVLGYLQALASTAQIGLFLLLGLLVFPSNLDEQALGALGVAVVLVLVARPLAVVALDRVAGVRPARADARQLGGPARRGADRAGDLPAHRRATPTGS